MKAIRAVAALLVLLPLAGCVSVGGMYGGSSGVGVGVATHTGVHNGSVQAHTLRLTRELKIAPGRARAFFQDGVQSGGKDRYRPYCEFEISTVSERPQWVRPDTFTIRRVERRTVTDEDTGMPLFFPTVFGSQDIFYETHLWLDSRRQPGVRKLVCRDWSQDFGRGGHLSGRAIQSVLGDSLVLE